MRREFHVCHKCAHRWRDPNPIGCPNCKAIVSWLESFWTRLDAMRCKPLVEQDRENEGPAAA